MSSTPAKKPAAPAPQRLRALWPDIKAIVEPRKGSLAIGLLLIVISRLAGMVLPASMRYLVDDIIGKHRQDLLLPLVAAVVVATILQGVSSFTLTQLLSKAAQRLIAELRQKVQSHVARLPISYFDTHKSGELVSRIMNDVEGVRNLVGTGLVELLGGILTAFLALFVLLNISPMLTGMALAIVLSFGFVLQKGNSASNACLFS